MLHNWSAEQDYSDVCYKLWCVNFNTVLLFQTVSVTVYCCTYFAFKSDWKCGHWIKCHQIMKSNFCQKEWDTIWNYRFWETVWSFWPYVISNFYNVANFASDILAFESVPYLQGALCTYLDSHHLNNHFLYVSLSALQGITVILTNKQQ